MFDPTVFENLKVAFENQLYDLDNLDERIAITGREDVLDLAVMSRRFVLRFTPAGRPAVTAAVVLEAGVADLASEILETPGAVPACTIRVRFELDVRDADEACRQVEHELRAVWGHDVRVSQTLHASYRGEAPVVWRDEAEVSFNRRINEEQMGDLPDLIEHILVTMERLNETFVR